MIAHPLVPDAQVTAHIVQDDLTSSAGHTARRTKLASLPHAQITVRIVLDAGSAMIYYSYPAATC